VYSSLWRPFDLKLSIWDAATRKKDRMVYKGYLTL